MNIHVVPGVIEIEGITGHVNEHGFILTVSTKEKYVEASCAVEDENETIVYLGANERTLRDGKPIPEGESAMLTMIILPGGYACEACSGRYSARLIGTRRQNTEPTPINFTVSRT